jgi:hypothetical protein
LSASRTRKHITKQHRKILTKEFELNSLPKSDKIKELSLITNLNYVTIKTWFRNMRYKYVKFYKQKEIRSDSKID